MPATPVFILGFPRSGTTLLAQILASNPNVAVLEEKPLLAKAIGEFATDDGTARLAALSDAETEEYRADFWHRAAQYGIDIDGKLLLEQTAFNTIHLPVIAKIFPNAKIVFAVRDPRDVVFSCFRRQFAPTLYTLEFQTLHGAARLYDATMQLAEACRARLGVQPFEIRNEDVIADFDRQTQRLCEFVGLPWNERIRDFPRLSRERRLATRSAPQVRRGISADGVGSWRRYREQLAPVLPTLRPWVERFGYSPD